MIRYGKGKKGNAIKIVSQNTLNGITTVREKIIIHANYLGDDITMVGWNGQSRTRSFMSPKWAATLRYINNKTVDLSQPTKKTSSRPAPLST